MAPPLTAFSRAGPTEITIYHIYRNCRTDIILSARGKFYHACLVVFRYRGFYINSGSPFVANIQSRQKLRRAMIGRSAESGIPTWKRKRDIQYFRYGQSQYLIYRLFRKGWIFSYAYGYSADKNARESAGLVS